MRNRAVTAACLVGLLLGLAPGTARAQRKSYITVKFLYALSDSNGPISSSWASLLYDAAHKELYVLDRHDGTVGIFNDVGMEVFRFGDDPELGTILSLAVMDGGDLLTLSLEKSQPVLWRCNFRGEPKERIELRNVPPAFAKDFAPEVVAFRNDRIYLVQKGTMKVLVTDVSGNFLEARDLFRELGMDKVKEARGNPGMHGFNLDDDGDLLFTVAPLFQVFVVPPEGKARSFGQKGGAPGKFNITGGVTRDALGNYFVTDVLKCAVLVFDAAFDFKGQFGERGWEPADLISPIDVAAGDGKVFVSQGGGRGVSVFQIAVGAPAAPAGQEAAATQPQP